MSIPILPIFHDTVRCTVNAEKYKNYDVYVYELMEGTISEKDKNGLKEMIDEANLKSLILQLIEGLDQLKGDGWEYFSFRSKPSFFPRIFPFCALEP